MPTRTNVMVSRGILALILLTGLSLAMAGGPDPKTPAGEPEDIAQLMQGIDGMRRLPVQGVQMVQSGARVFFVSTNGRYAFLGPAIDLWHGERLTSLADADRLMRRIDRARLKLDPGDLGALDLGKGAEDVWVFLDPQCPQCAHLLDQLQALLPSQRASYRIRLIPLGVLGQASLNTVVRLNCLAERDATAATQALVTHALADLPPAEGTCGQGALQRALVTAQLLGITQVPFLIAPDGRLRAGAPTDLLAWLTGDAP